MLLLLVRLPLTGDVGCLGVADQPELTFSSNRATAIFAEVCHGYREFMVVSRCSEYLCLHDGELAEQLGSRTAQAQGVFIKLICNRLH